MAKSKKRSSKAAAAAAAALKQEETPDTPMSTSSIPATASIKPESRTVSPSPSLHNTLTISGPKFDFDGGLMQEEPEFEEDFIPAEGEEIDLTSLAVPAPAPAEGEHSNGANQKRTMEDDDNMAVGFEDGPTRKKTRLDDGEIETPSSATITPVNSTVPADKLSSQLWTEIFTYIGLPSIGKLRVVSKRFVELLDKEHIWRRCRKIHCPDMPKPAFGMKEWDMWRLVRGTGCMTCSKFEGKVRGQDGMKVYWQFKVRCCEACFRTNVIKEADLVGKPDEQIPMNVMKELVSALPYGLVDSKFGWVPTTIPNPQDVQKVYWKQDIEEIKGRYDEALQMDAAEEWLKGLEGEGHGHKADADRMEKWEVRVMQGNSYNPSVGLSQQMPHQQQQQHKKAEKSQVNIAKNNGIPVLVTNDNPHPHSAFLPQSIPTFYQRNRQFGDRSNQEADDVKTRRKTDIEIRCSKLNPPIPAEVLAHCAAFQASVKIAQPLTEQSWNALLPKLLEQRAGAEEHEKQRQSQRKQLEQQLEDRKLQETQERDQWVKKERQWEESQAPVREMIAKIADEEIKNWHGKVTFESAPSFAAAILTIVRTRYYERGGVQETSPVSDPTLPSSSSHPSSGASSGKVRQLVLENMKYVFDNKVKPMTDPFRRELFYCKACKEIAANPAAAAAASGGMMVPPPPPKLYGFEGVIQHYAAKHTTDLSLGTIVVHWRSLWPEEAPFVVDPNEIKRLMIRPPGGHHGHHHHHHQPHHHQAVGLPQAPVLMRPGPPVSVPVGGVPVHGGYPYPSHQPPHGRHQMHPMHHGPTPPPPPAVAGPGPQPVMQGYGRGITPHRPSAYPDPGYHPAPVGHHPHVPVGVPPTHPHHGHHAHPSQYPSSSPLAVGDRGQPYPPQYAAPTVYPQHQPQPPQPVPQYGPYASGYPPAQPHPHYGGYEVASHHRQHGGVYAQQPPVPQPDPYGEAAKREAEATAAAAEAAAAAAAEKDRKDRKDKIRYIANYAEQMWKNLGSIKTLEPSIRALQMIHDTVSSFEEKYKADLPIQLFHESIRTEIDGAMKFLKPGNIKFECRSCPKTSTRTFTLALLFQHFESVHVSRPSLGPSAAESGVKAKRFNWLVDMIRLPVEEEVGKLVGRQGIDVRRIGAVEKVYPGVFQKKIEIPVIPPVAAAEVAQTAPKHASKASMSAAEDFLNNLIPQAAAVEQTKKESSTGSDQVDPRDVDRSEATSRTLQSQSRQRSSRSRSPVSVDSRTRSRSRGHRRRDSYDDYYHRRGPVAREYPDDEYRRYDGADGAYYPSRPPVNRRASPGPYGYEGRFPSPPRRYRMYRPSYDDYDVPPPARERYPGPAPSSPPPQVMRSVRTPGSPTAPAAGVPPPVGGLDYDDPMPPAPVIPVSGHAREARYADDVEYRRAYAPAHPPPHAEYYDRVMERERYPPPPHAAQHPAYYDRPPHAHPPPPPGRYYDEPGYVRHSAPQYYYDDYEYERGRAPPPPHAPPPHHPGGHPVRVYREDYERYYDRERDFGGYPPEERGRGRSRSPMGRDQWEDRERRGYARDSSPSGGSPVQSYRREADTYNNQVDEGLLAGRTLGQLWEEARGQVDSDGSEEGEGYDDEETLCGNEGMSEDLEDDDISEFYYETDESAESGSETDESVESGSETDESAESSSETDESAQFGYETDESSSEARMDGRTDLIGPERRITAAGFRPAGLPFHKQGWSSSDVLSVKD
ncbi:hypothetical protein TWF106_008508 [Orbilia oligospora]|uniref:F-box domain-containing protein n=1 Tax=Orbilia oligospora TaxID=2813651 RepID=A0A7C8UMQ0_ORBOL|nr:hypothetical protein TWF106_008508 [Orbilia oligospora]